MTQNEEQLSALNDIRDMMERSSKFISLNGFSGVFIGIFALAGAAIIYLFLDSVGTSYGQFIDVPSEMNTSGTINFLLMITLTVLSLSLAVSSWLTMRKAKKNSLKIWDSTTKRMLMNLMIPLFTGGFFCLIMLYHGLTGFIAPAMLIFYGLALINSSKYTFFEIRYLGIAEIILGLSASVFLPSGLILWAAGFGLLHIIYGMIMYYKYERKPVVNQ